MTTDIKTRIENYEEVQETNILATKTNHAYVVTRTKHMYVALFNRKNWGAADQPTLFIITAKKNLLANNANVDVIVADDTEDVRKIVAELKSKPEKYITSGRLEKARVADALQVLQGERDRLREAAADKKAQKEMQRISAQQMLRETGSVTATQKYLTQKVGAAGWDEHYYGFSDG